MKSLGSRLTKIPFAKNPTLVNWCLPRDIFCLWYDITYIKRYCWKGLKHIYVLSTLWTKWKTYLVKSTKKCDNSVEIWPLPLGCAEQPFTIWLYSLHFPQDTRFKFNIHKTFRRRLGRPWNELCMFNLRFVFRTFFTILI